MTDLSSRLNSLLSAEPNPSRRYFAITLLCSEEGKLQFSCFSGWAGFTDDKPPREIREASIVHADRIVETWRKAGYSATVVNSLDDMALFFHVGGNAVIDEQIARAVIPEWLKPAPVAMVGEYGYAHIESLPAGSLKRAPTPKHRMRILKRDGFRCRICGRSSNDHVDIELHVHHIRPWELGGVTEDQNLVTLCHTCHNGLDPHFEPTLFPLIQGGRGTGTESPRLRDYWIGVQRYRERVAEDEGRGSPLQGAA